ncbi:unnamed protein product, partial [Didymodactylos carnosus]
CATELPITLKFLHTGSVLLVSTESQKSADNFCLFWIAYNFTLNVTGLFLITYATIERYLLIFHKTIFSKKINLFLFHYLSILFSIIYPLLFYIGVVLIYPCENEFSYTSFVCGQPCYQFNVVPTLVECFLNLFTPVCITTIINLLIILRVLIQKRRMKQASTWNKNKKMDYLNYVTYLAALVCPFVCIMALSEVRKKLIIIYRTTYCYRMIPQQRVRPLLTGVTGTAITANGGGNERGGDTTGMMLKPMTSTVVATISGGGNFVPETKKR